LAIELGGDYVTQEYRRLHSEERYGSSAQRRATYARQFACPNGTTRFSRDGLPEILRGFLIKFVDIFQFR